MSIVLYYSHTCSLRNRALSSLASYMTVFLPSCSVPCCSGCSTVTGISPCAECVCVCVVNVNVCVWGGGGGEGVRVWYTCKLVCVCVCVWTVEDVYLRSADILVLLAFQSQCTCAYPFDFPIIIPSHLSKNVSISSATLSFSRIICFA